MKTPRKHSPMPEWLSRQDREGAPWTVREGAPLRGRAFTDIGARQMVTPTGDSPIARIIRAHEMTHAKCSPMSPQACIASLPDLASEAIISAEELRINWLTKRAGFNIDDLLDGSEKHAGQLLAHEGINSWAMIVEALAIGLNTKANRHLIAGIKSVNPSLAQAANMAQKKMKTAVIGILNSQNNKRYGYTDDDRTRWVADTREAENNGQKVTRGYLHFTEPMARVIDSLMKCQSDDEYGDHETSLTEKVTLVTTPTPDGQFARLIIQPLPLTKSLNGRIGRKRIASATGRNMRRIDRLLTDPERRVFDRRARANGGIVLIDQSGSMSLDESDLQAILEVASGCVVIGYSHAKGTTDRPNVWVIANRGKTIETIPRGNGGNGVDGPAIRFAQTFRKKGEPFVWVCDGCVTDGRNDSERPNLAQECINLVMRLGIHMTENVAETVEALRLAQTQTLEMKIARRLQEGARE